MFREWQYRNQNRKDPFPWPMLGNLDYEIKLETMSDYEWGLLEHFKPVKILAKRLMRQYQDEGNNDGLETVKKFLQYFITSKITKRVMSTAEYKDAGVGEIDLIWALVDHPAFAEFMGAGEKMFNKEYGENNQIKCEKQRDKHFPVIYTCVDDKRSVQYYLNYKGTHKNIGVIAPFLPNRLFKRLVNLQTLLLVPEIQESLNMNYEGLYDTLKAKFNGDPLKMALYLLQESGKGGEFIIPEVDWDTMEPIPGRTIGLYQQAGFVNDAECRQTVRAFGIEFDSDINSESFVIYYLTYHLEKWWEDYNKAYEFLHDIRSNSNSKPPSNPDYQLLYKLLKIPFMYQEWKPPAAGEESGG